VLNVKAEYVVLDGSARYPVLIKIELTISFDNTGTLKCRYYYSWTD
jgi:hypothetical protein